MNYSLSQNKSVLTPKQHLDIAVVSTYESLALHFAKELASNLPSANKVPHTFSYARIFLPYNHFEEQFGKNVSRFDLAQKHVSKSSLKDISHSLALILPLYSLDSLFLNRLIKQGDFKNSNVDSIPSLMGFDRSTLSSPCDLLSRFLLPNRSAKKAYKLALEELSFAAEFIAPALEKKYLDYDF
ncbi:MAG: hypothetical protein ACOCQQ_00225 [Candidatus Nanoarchaeia archaeon]